MYVGNSSPNQDMHWPDMKWKVSPKHWISSKEQQKGEISVFDFTIITPKSLANKESDMADLTEMCSMQQNEKQLNYPDPQPTSIPQKK